MAWDLVSVILTFAQLCVTVKRMMHAADAQEGKPEFRPHPTGSAGVGVRSFGPDLDEGAQIAKR